MKGLIAVTGRSFLLRLLLMVLVFSSAEAVQMRAQVVGGTILGTITDRPVQSFLRHDFDQEPGERNHSYRQNGCGGLLYRAQLAARCI